MDYTNNPKLLNLWLTSAKQHKLLKFTPENFLDTEYHNIVLYPYN